MVVSLTSLLDHYPEDKAIATTWIKAVLPLTLDPEAKVQERVVLVSPFCLVFEYFNIHRLMPVQTWGHIHDNDWMMLHLLSFIVLYIGNFLPISMASKCESDSSASKKRKAISMEVKLNKIKYPEKGQNTDKHWVADQQAV